MSLSVLTLLLTALAVHAAPSGPVVEITGDVSRGSVVGAQCPLVAYIAQVTKILISRKRFENKVPKYAVKAHKAFHGFVELTKKSPEEICNSNNEENWTTLVDIVLGAFGFIAALNNEVKEEAYKFLDQHWDFLPQMVGKAVRLANGDHYCLNQTCARRQILGTIYDLANNGKISRMSVEEEVQRVEKVVHGKCNAKQVEEEEHCGGQKKATA